MTIIISSVSGPVDCPYCGTGQNVQATGEFCAGTILRPMVHVCQICSKAFVWTAKIEATAKVYVSAVNFQNM